LRIGFSFRRGSAFADRRYEWRARRETGLATVFAPCLHEDRPKAIGASHNAHGRGLCDDQGVRTTVLIVDDHEAFRESVSTLLEAEGFVVLGEAADGAAAIVEFERLRPDVVLLDIQLPDLDGFRVAERLAAAPEPPAVVLISSRDAEAYGARLEAAPTQGFIPKRELSGAALAALIG
jgi:CheY-like chemotaxis protein